MRAHNQGVGLAVLALAGTAVAAGGAGQVKDIRQAANAPGAVATVPAGHLLAGPIVVPPGMHAERWVTLYCERPHHLHRVSTVQITYKSDDGDKETVALVLRRILPPRPGAPAASD